MTENKPWDWNKFKQGMLDLTSGELWGKDITGTINIRRIIIYIVIGLLIYVGIAGYWFWKGKKTKPVTTTCENTNIVIKSPVNKGENLTIKTQDGKWYLNDKVITEGDMPNLKPYGFQSKPFLSIGLGMGDNKFEKEIGVGLSVIKFYSVNGGILATDKGGYIELDYKLTDNFYLLGGYGKKYKTLNERIIVGGKLNF